MTKKMLGYSMATWVSALITFLLMPLASHLYSSHELGVINYYYSIINIIFTFILLGLDQAYLRFYSEYNPQERKSQFTKNIAVTTLCIFILCLISLPFSKKISVWLIDRETASIAAIIFIHIIGLTVTRYFVILYRLKSSLAKYTIFSIINTILLKMVYILGFPIKNDAYTGILTTGIISIIAAGLLTIVEIKSFSLIGLFTVTPKDQEEFRYALPLIPAMLFALLNNNIPQIVLRSRTDFSNIAVFSIGVTLASTITLLHNGINTFLEPFIFNNYDTNKDQISKVLNLFTVIAYLLCMFVILFQNMFFFVFKKDYIVSTQFLPFLLCSSLWYSIGDFYNIGVKISKRTKENISIYLIGFVVNYVLSLLLISRLECVGAAISASAASAVISAMKIIKGNKYYKTVNNYNNIIVGAIILVIISFGNLLFWTSQWKYCFPITGIIFYVLFTGIYKDVVKFLHK